MKIFGKSTKNTCVTTNQHPAGILEAPIVLTPEELLIVAAGVDQIKPITIATPLVINRTGGIQIDALAGMNATKF